MTQPDNNVVLTEVAAQQLRDDFLGWQCRLRQLSARQAGGRPLEGMRPKVLSSAGNTISPGIVVLIIERDPASNTQMLRFQCQKTQDPNERYDKILDLLSAAYFQHPKNFSDEMTALFGPASELPATLLHLGRCVLEFEQFTEAYRVPCAVTELPEAHAFYQATYWHNHMFNPNLPPGIRILAFKPDWPHASTWRIEA
ncbi:MAG TPA: hypothetical protein VFZ03_14715 [Dongiaceae bacterium]